MADARTGDTVTHFDRRAEEAVIGYKEAKPMVFSGLFPIYGEQFDELVEAIEKLKLNDAALVYERKFSLWFGFVWVILVYFIWRLSRKDWREFNLELITTAPSVKYRITNTPEGNLKLIILPSFQSLNRVELMEEPFVKQPSYTQ